jgi:hypothetical protein
VPDVSFTNLLVVAAIAVLAPLTVGFAPSRPRRSPCPNPT